MKVSMQVCLVNGWDNNNPVIHNVSSWKEATDLAYAISHQLGNVTVRLVKISDWVPDSEITLKYIGCSNGYYIQSTEPNVNLSGTYIEHTLKKYENNNILLGR